MSSSTTSTKSVRSSKFGTVNSPIATSNRNVLRKSEIRFGSKSTFQQRKDKENWRIEANPPSNPISLQILLPSTDPQLIQIQNWWRDERISKTATNNHHDVSPAQPIKIKQDIMDLTENDLDLVITSLTASQSSDLECKTMCLKILVKICIDIYCSQNGDDIESLIFIFLELLEGPSEDSRVYAFELLFNVALHLSLPGGDSDFASWAFSDLQRKLIHLLDYMIENQEQSLPVWKTASKALFAFIDNPFSTTLVDPKIVFAILRHVEDLPWKTVNYLLTFYISHFYDDENHLIPEKVASAGGIDAFLLLFQDQIAEECQKIVFNVIYDYILDDLMARKKILDREKVKQTLEALKELIIKNRFWKTCWSLTFHVQNDFVESYTLKLFQEPENHHFLRRLDKSFLVSFLCDCETIIKNFTIDDKASFDSSHHTDKDMIIKGLASCDPRRRIKSKHLLKFLLSDTRTNAKKSETACLSGKQIDKLLLYKGLHMLSTKTAILDLVFSMILQNRNENSKFINLYLGKFAQIKDSSPRLAIRLLYLIMNILDIESKSDDGILVQNQKALDSLVSSDILKYLFTCIPGRNFRFEKLIALNLLILKSSSNFQIEASFYYDLVKGYQDPIISYQVSKFLVHQIGKENPSLLQDIIQRYPGSGSNYFILVNRLLASRSKRDSKNIK